MHFDRRKKTKFDPESGQDLVEYALMAGFVAVAAGAIMPGVANLFGLGLQEVLTNHPEQEAIKVICALLAAVLLGIIVLRRKKNAE